LHIFKLLYLFVRKTPFLLLLVCFLIPVTLCAQVISLAGEWKFALDPDNKGLEESWFNATLKDAIKLPGSCEEQGFGEKSKSKEVYRLTRAVRYEGVAWYQRELSIPASWSGKRVELFLERCHWESSVWIDGKPLGMRNSLSAPHRYDLLNLLPGKHILTVAIDNRYKIPIGSWGFAITDDTQGNWNGIIGRIELKATDPVWIRQVQVYNDHLQVYVGNQTGSPKHVTVQGTRQTVPPGGSSLSIPFKSLNTWDEFRPVTKTLITKLTSSKYADSVRTSYGVRSLTTKKGQFVLNGRPVLMRGPVNECIYPLTGYPPMDSAAWLRVLNICKSYGFNYMRFNSWCPPEAAFIAADQLGIFLQVELPFWSIDAPEYGKHPVRDQFLEDELIRILDEYGNHPSFAFMAMGNESPGPLDMLVHKGKLHDNRQLYRCQDGDTSTNGDYAERGTEIGQRGIKGPATNWNRWSLTQDEETKRYKNSALPTLAHEVGQWASYPDFDQLTKFTGNLKPYNYERFRDSLEAHKMIDQAKAFSKASGKFSLSLYKEEIEACLRTYPHGGFQVVEARDFPGEGTAIIGWLDAFWDSKGLISPEEFRRFCNETVCLLQLPKRVYTSTETLVASAGIAHYGAKNLRSAVKWKMETEAGVEIGNGVFPEQNISTGKYSEIGIIKASLKNVKQATRLIVTISAGSFSNNWSIWVYPETKINEPEHVEVVYHLDEAMSALNYGKRVLLFSSSKEGLHDIQSEFLPADSLRFFPPVRQGKNSIPGSFMPAFWDMRLFNQVGTLSILCDPSHPAFKSFPTDSFSNWQWADILGRFTALSSYRIAGDAKTHDWGDVFDRSKSIILNETPPLYRPILQMIDNYERNYKLGLIFETRVGKGKLLICSIDLDTDIEKRPSARQLKTSLVNYAGSESFDPAFELPREFLVRILQNN
jgi:hypothetical protein